MLRALLSEVTQDPGTSDCGREVGDGAALPTASSE